jgi:hypothetical protein
MAEQQEQERLNIVKVEKIEQQDEVIVEPAVVLTEVERVNAVDKTDEVERDEEGDKDEEEDNEEEDEEEEEEVDELEDSEEVVTTARKGCLTCSKRRLMCSWTAVDRGNGQTCDTCRASKIRCDVKGTSQKAKKAQTVNDNGKVLAAQDVQEETLRRSTRLYVGDPRRGSGTPKRPSESSEAGPSKRARTAEEWIMKETRELRLECKDMLWEMRRTQTVHGEALERHGRVLETLLRRLETGED